MSATLTVAVRFPIAAGVNVALIVQLALAAREPGQVVVVEKSPGSAPPVPIVVTVRAAFPVFVRVTDWAALVVPRFCAEKLSVPAERLAAGPVPVPVNATVCGLLARLSAMLIDAVRTPGAVGVNFTMIMQVAFCASVAGQLFDWEKSPALVPVTLTPDRVKLVLPVLVTVVDCDVPVVPTV